MPIDDGRLSKRSKHVLAPEGMKFVYYGHEWRVIAAWHDPEYDISWIESVDSSGAVAMDRVEELSKLMALGHAGWVED